MKFFVGITTYNRIKYLKQAIESIEETTKNSSNQFLVCINDDGSTDGSREYLKGLKNTENITYKILYSANKGGQFASAQILNYSRFIDYDFAFKMDDDVYFIQDGWEILYYNAYKESGYPHLSHYSTEWAKPNTNRVNKGKLTSVTDVWNSQGAFYTFTKGVLEKIGIMDYVGFGRRGEGHRDFSLRACRVGFNEKHTFWDAAGSYNYVKLEPKSTYIKTPGYSEEIKLAKMNAQQKKHLLSDEDRVFVETPLSPLNHFFDKIYCLNLKRRQDRKKKMQDLFSKLRMEVEFIKAVDGQSDPLCIELFNNKPLSNNISLNLGVYGCHLSHLKILEDIKAKGYQRPLILEDDIIAHKDFESRLHEIFELEDDWKILYLGASDYKFKYNKQNINGNSYIGKDIDGTFAYSVKPEILDELITEFKKTITKPCDTLLHTFQNKYRTRVIYQNLFISDVTGSDIRPDRDIYSNAKKLGWECDHYVHQVPEVKVITKQTIEKIEGYIDVMYPLKNSKFADIELLFSLRTLDKFAKGIRNVYIIGDDPKFTNENVKVYSLKEEGVKDYRIAKKIEFASRFLDDMSENFLFLNDDHFFNSEFDAKEYPYYQKGDLWVKGEEIKDYQKQLNQTHELLTGLGKPTKHFDVHCPIIYNKTKFIQIVPLLNPQVGYVVKSLYSNFHEIEGESYVDCKLRSLFFDSDFERFQNNVCFSIYDSALNHGVLEYLSKNFPDPSRFEKQDIRFTFKTVKRFYDNKEKMSRKPNMIFEVDNARAMELLSKIPDYLKIIKIE